MKDQLHESKCYGNDIFYLYKELVLNVIEMCVAKVYIVIIVIIYIV